MKEDEPKFEFDEGELDAELAKILDETPAKQKSLCRALIVSPIDAPAALRAALNMVGSPAPVVNVGSRSAVYLEVEEEGDADALEMLALLGSERPLPDKVDEMGRLLSKLSRGGAVVLASWVSAPPSSEEKPAAQVPVLTGTMAARRYVDGDPEDVLPSGLVLSTMAVAAEELLLGRIALDEVEDYSPGGPWTGWLKGRGRH